MSIPLPAPGNVEFYNAVDCSNITILILHVASVDATKLPTANPHLVMNMNPSKVKSKSIIKV